MNSKHFIPFKVKVSPKLIPDKLNDPFETAVPEICEIAALELQEFLLENQKHWKHNFGFDSTKGGIIKGKMFGVLIVETESGELGYLCTFSGKLADEEIPQIFVPSLFDLSRDDFFLTEGMTELTAIGNQIKSLQEENTKSALISAEELKEIRKDKSVALQNKLFDQYHFLNKAGNSESLISIFEEYNNRKPAAGAGECSAPKLLHYAFKNKLRPLAIAEFWWGKSDNAKHRKHKNFYPACADKCRPILGYMLSE